jgi:hypothetical protein
LLASDISFSVFYNECSINAWWIRDKPALRCQHFMELLWDAAVREYYKIMAKLHGNALPDGVKQSKTWLGLNVAATYCKHCAAHCILASPLAVEGEADSDCYPYSALHTRPSLTGRELIKSCLCSTALSFGSDTTLECIFGGCTHGLI